MSHDPGCFRARGRLTPRRPGPRLPGGGGFNVSSSDEPTNHRKKIRMKRIRTVVALAAVALLGTAGAASAASSWSSKDGVKFNVEPVRWSNGTG